MLVREGHRPFQDTNVKFAIVGTRGIPARYGGFETFAEELSTRLAARGHHVTVYCRQKSESPYRGVLLAYLPTIRHKYLDTIVHTFLSTLHLLAHRHDAVLYCNAANAVFTWMPRVFGMPVALNVDGLERNRKKWNRTSQGLVSSLRMARHMDAKRSSDGRRRDRRILSGTLSSIIDDDFLRRGNRSGRNHSGPRAPRLRAP